MRRVLFVSENITLAQVVRLLALAEALPRDRYEVHFACGQGDDWLFEGQSFRRWSLSTLDGPSALSALARGKRIYEQSTLERYVKDELELLSVVKPDVVVGDFRLSLSVSTRVYGVHCGSLINAYWSPFAERESFPMPDHPLVRLFGDKLAARYFPQALPHVFAYFAAPLDAVRKRYGLAKAPLLEQLCFGDSVLYADIPELCPIEGAPASHHFLGAVPWAPSVPLPSGLRDPSAARPLVYVTLGSSGDRGALPQVLEGLGSLPIRGLLATAGKPAPSRIPENFQVVDYAPGAEVARLARFVVTNGGSSTGYQALAAGAPVLGIASNLDQCLASQAITRAGAGLSLRAGSVSSREVQAAATRLLEEPSFGARARQLSGKFAMYDCHARFQNWLNTVLVVLLLLLSPARRSLAQESLVTNVLEFETRVGSDAGLVRCGLFKQGGWLKDAFRASTARVHDKKALCVFKEVPPGTYGISAFHDENSDGKLDTNLVGYPTEEYCASNNARNLMSAPSWKDARFAYRGGAQRLRCIMK